MKQTLAGARWVVLVVAALTVLGFALRLARYQQTVFGDELSTLYGVDGRSLTEVTSYVSSDAEISPPLFFILAWLTTKLGSAPELVRLPSLIAGTVSIPLVYLVGARAINRPAGLIAAGVMALSPFMIFYSADGRGYAVAIALLLGSTLAMLEGARTGNARWWVAYGAFSLLAMYTHYTAAFPLVAQFFWLLWAHPSARRPALIANAAAVVAYLPWISGLAADFDSPTTDILYAIQGSGLAAKLRAIESWAAGYPYVTLSDFLERFPPCSSPSGLWPPQRPDCTGASMHVQRLGRSYVRPSLRTGWPWS
ncbi:MAG: glycosyltransferase family 39 protein [Solirubrobacterales bacterium]